MSVREVAAPDVTDTWSPPPGAEGIAPLSCDEIGGLFAYDPQAPLDVEEVSRRRQGGVTVIDLTYASPKGGRVPAALVVPEGAGPFAGMLYQHGMPSTHQFRVWVLLPLGPVILYMLVKALLDLVLRIDPRRNRLAHLAYVALTCLALFRMNRGPRARFSARRPGG